MIYIACSSSKGKGKGIRARAQIPPSPSPFNACHAGYDIYVINWGLRYISCWFRQWAKRGKSCVLIGYPFRICSFGLARKSYSYPRNVFFDSRLGERRNRYARRKVDVFFRDHRVVFDRFVSILQGPVRPRKMVEFNPGLSQISSAVFSCYSKLHNTVEPLQQDTVMITQNVTLSNAWECKILKRNKILILD